MRLCISYIKTIFQRKYIITYGEILQYDNRVMNLNLDYKTACELSEKVLSHDEMIEMLKKGNVPQKQFAALNLDCINNEEEGKILISNLTGCDGKIREAVALKINQLLNANSVRFSQYIYPYPEVFADASIDINANICRLVIGSVGILKDNPDFSQKYLEKILQFIYQTFEEIDKFIFRDKKYVINKQLFKLYWCLESLKLFVNDISGQTLFSILKRASEEKEYTIREKIAQILCLTNNEIFIPLKNKLIQDENYYVREALKTLK